MAKPTISQSLRSRLKSSPGYTDRSGVTSGTVRSGVRLAMAKSEKDMDEVYREEVDPVSTENRAGWIASINDFFFGDDDEDTETPSSTYDEGPVTSDALSTSSRTSIDSLPAGDNQASLELGSSFDYNSVREVPAMLDEGFTSAAEQVAANMNLPVHWLYAVIDTESGFDPQVRNEEYVRQGREEDAAIGSIQFMPATAEELGTSVEELRNMSLTEQLTYVERYYERYSDRIRDPEDMYVATLYPAALGRDDDFVLGSQTDTPSASISAVYSGQPSMDTDNDRQITLGEVKQWYRNSRGYNRFIQPFQMPSN